MFHVFLFYIFSNDDAHKQQTLNRSLWKQHQSLLWGCKPKKTNVWPVQQESGETAWKSTKLSERQRQTCESAEGVGRGLQTQRIQSQGLGQGLHLGLRQRLRERVSPCCGLDTALDWAHLNNRLLHTEKNAWMGKCSKSDILLNRLYITSFIQSLSEQHMVFLITQSLNVKTTLKITSISAHLTSVYDSLLPKH